MNDETETDPYGHLTWAIGSSEDFWCFDYHSHEDGTVTLHAVINSDAGHFIADAEPPCTLPADQAVAEARRLTESALDWCSAHDIEHDTEGWNQDPSYFWRCVESAVNGLPGLVERIEPAATTA
jgi:hypothetical protein